jgi:CRP-like cAMP-binding protein
MVAMLAEWGGVAAALPATFWRQRLSGVRLPRPFVAIARTGGRICQLDSRIMLKVRFESVFERRFIRFQARELTSTYEPHSSLSDGTRAEQAIPNRDWRHMEPYQISRQRSLR